MDQVRCVLFHILVCFFYSWNKVAMNSSKFRAQFNGSRDINGAYKGTKAEINIGDILDILRT